MFYGSVVGFTGFLLQQANEMSCIWRFPASIFSGVWKCFALNNNCVVG